MTDIDLDGVRGLLCQLQDTVRDALIRARDSRPASSLAEVAEVTAADTIYRIDKVSEEVILEWFGRFWPAGWSVELVMEGAEGGDAHTFPSGTPVERQLLVLGRGIPVNVMRELDVKLDDGLPTSGVLRQAATSGAQLGAAAQSSADCIDDTAQPPVWNIAANAQDCNGVLLY
jgi:hypothetical protein